MLSSRVIVLATTVLSIALPAAGQPIECGTTYTVRSGDALGLIARRAYGDGYLQRLYQANRRLIGPNINYLEIGWELQIPCSFDGTGPVGSETAQPAQAGTGTANAGVQVVIAAPAQPNTLIPEEISTANFDAAPELVGQTPRATEALPRVEIVFNRASAPKFILNVGIIDPFLADITRATEGRVTFRDPEVVNRDPAVQLELVETGAVDGAYVFNGYLEDSHPLIQITMMPLIGGSALETAVALWRVHEQYFVEAQNFGNVKLLGFIAAPPAHIWRVAEAPVTYEERLAGNNQWAVPYFEGLDTRGAQVVRAENAARIQAADNATGAPATYFLAHGAARAVGVWQPGRVVTEIQGGVYVPTFSVVISLEKWNEIAPQDQQAILALSGETLALRSIAWDAFDNGHKAQMLEQGLVIIDAREDFELMAELQDEARVQWEAWIARADAEGVSGFKAINAFMREVETLRAEYRGQ